MRIRLSQIGMVCSAHAEVIPSSRRITRAIRSLLRTRGGDPEKIVRHYALRESAPHTRR